MCSYSPEPCWGCRCEGSQPLLLEHTALSTVCVCGGGGNIMIACLYIIAHKSNGTCSIGLTHTNSFYCFYTHFTKIGYEGYTHNLMFYQRKCWTCLHHHDAVNYVIIIDHNYYRIPVGSKVNIIIAPICRYNNLLMQTIILFFIPSYVYCCFQALAGLRLGQKILNE